MYFSDKFICASKEYAKLNKQAAAPYFRKCFWCDEIRKMELTITGLGFYRLYLNGTEITKGLLSPYISNTNDIVYYDHYDITPYLVQGENTIGVCLGNGMQNAFGGFVWDFEKTVFRSAPVLALALEADGTLILEADETFQTHDSPIMEDDLRLGEWYDARREIKGWNLPGFDDADWKNAQKAETPQGEKRLCQAKPITCEKKVPPVRIWKEGSDFVYDFGINTAGTVKLKVRGEKGQRITLLFGEILKDGKFYWENTGFIRPEYAHMRPYRQEDVYICRGEDTEYYEPGFTYHGFRYVKVSGITEEQAEEQLLTMCIYHTQLERNGAFVCSDPVINAIQKMVENSTESNFYHFPTDCPQREKNGWTADAALSAEQTMLNYAPVENYKEWMRNVCRAQAEDGSLPGIVPTWGWGFEWGNGPAWDCVLTEIPYAVYKYMGDTEIIEIVKEAVKRYLRYLEKKKNEKGLVAFGLGDWQDPSGTGITCQAPLELTDSIYAMHFAQQAAELLYVAGEKEESRDCMAFAGDMKEKIRTHLLDKETMTFAGECQTSQAMGIYYGVVTEKEAETAFWVLEKLIHRDGDRIYAGVLGLKVIFHVLAAYGRAGLAYKMITRTDVPSYGYWVKQGNTTLEEYMPYTKSGNHHYMGDVSAWFYRWVCGIEYSYFEVEENRLHFRPVLLEEIPQAGACCIVRDGKISLEYEYQKDTVVIRIGIPAHTKAMLHLPQGWQDALGRQEFCCGSGIYIAKKYE